MFKKFTALALAGAFLFTGTNAFAQEVKQGDTMYKIAQENNMSLQELASLNPQVKNLNLIYVGQNINTNKNETQVNKPVTSTAVDTKVNTSVSASDRDLLARLVRAEAESEPYAGKVAVATVVLNRVESSQFPNSIHDVIYQSGQFTPVSNGEINKPARDIDFKATDEALNSVHPSAGGSLFFYNPNTASSRWLDSRPTVIVIGNHVFKK